MAPNWIETVRALSRKLSFIKQSWIYIAYLGVIVFIPGWAIIILNTFILEVTCLFYLVSLSVLTFVFCLLDDGISIPCSYTSFIAPVHSPKLYGEVSARHKDPTKVSEMYNFEMPFVVHQQNKLILADIQPLFMYEHPNKGILLFTLRVDCYAIALSKNLRVLWFSFILLQEKLGYVFYTELI